MKPQSATVNEHQAAEWVVRMEFGNWSDAQEAELEVWLQGDPRRRGALLQAQAAWMTLDWPEAADDQQRTAIQATAFTRRRILMGGGAAIAASLAGGLFLLTGASSYTTNVGEIRRVPLADGSIAAINTASTMAMTLAEGQRKVRIARGEVWFQVAKDPERPFLVEAGPVRVQAIGTAFSVRRRVGGADILVTEGVVEAWADQAEGHRIRLSAGMAAFVADNAAIIPKAPEPSAIDRALAWRSGKIALAGSSLAEAVAEFNRYNGRKLVLADPALAGERFDGVFRTDDPEGFAKAVKDSLDVPIELGALSEIRIGQKPL